jgi:hypothetical protein
LIEVNVTKEDIDAIQPTLRQLIYPQNTVLDQSIATALWFAARGQGNSISRLSYLARGKNSS